MSKTMETPKITISNGGIYASNALLAGQVTMNKPLTNADVLDIAAGMRAVPIEKIPVASRLAWIQNQNRVSRAAGDIQDDVNALAQANAKRDEKGNVVQPVDKDGNPIPGMIALADPKAHGEARRELLAQPCAVHLRLLPEHLFIHLSSETDHPTRDGEKIPAVSSDVLAALYPIFDVEG